MNRNILLMKKKKQTKLDNSKNILFLGAIDELRLLYKYGADQLHVDKNSLSGTNYENEIYVYIF